MASEGREGAFREDPWGVKVGASERQERVGVGKDCEGTTSALRTCDIRLFLQLHLCQPQAFSTAHSLVHPYLPTCQLTS